MATTVWEYFEERERECKKLSLHPEDAEGVGYGAEAGSDGKRGRIVMRLRMSERAYLAISELVVVRRNSIHREEYAYYLVIDGQEYWSRDFDSIHGYHGHTIGHERVVAGRVTFKKAVEQAWEILSQEEELTGTEPPA